MDYQTILILATLGAVIHVAEEYKYGWIKWANKFIPGVTVKQFMVVNVLFIILCIISVFVGNKNIIFSSSIFSLMLINALVHIGPAIKQKKYSPGVYSAASIFIPLGVFGYTKLFKDGFLSLNDLAFSFAIGFLWMSVPFIIQITRIMCERRS